MCHVVVSHSGKARPRHRFRGRYTVAPCRTPPVLDAPRKRFGICQPVRVLPCRFSKEAQTGGQGRVLSYFVQMGCNICCHIAPYPYFADSKTLNQTLLRVRCASFLCASPDGTLLEGRAKAQTDCNRSREIRVLKPRRRRGDPPREIARHLVNSLLGVFSVIFLKPALFALES
jgi:hypothetical protein